MRQKVEVGDSEIVVYRNKVGIQTITLNPSLILKALPAAGRDEIIIEIKEDLAKTPKG